MKCHQSIFPLLFPLLFLSGIKQTINPNSITESKWSGTIRNAQGAVEFPELNIADTRIVEGNAGQRIAEVMVAMPHVKPAPVIAVFSTRNGTALAGSDYVAKVDSLYFAPGDLMNKIKIPINSDIAVEADETFQVALVYLSGIKLADSIGVVTIVNDDFKAGNPSSGNPSSGNPSSGNPSIGNLAVYELRFIFTGYTSFTETPANCPIRSKGTVVLSGLLMGPENVTADEDINYSGMLQMDMDIDICSYKPGPRGDDAQNCGITIIGSGAMKTDLKISFDGRGGYIMTKNESGLFMKNASGSCDQAQIDEERNMIPNETIASVFNGIDLPMLTTRTLAVGRWVTPTAEGELVVEVLRKVKP